MNIPFPIQFEPLFDKSWRHIGFHGGRGGAKSWSFASALLEKGRQEKLRIRCLREIQNTIADSVHQLLVDTINRHNWHDYKYNDKKIWNTVTGTEIKFGGMLRNVQNLKGLEWVDIVWIEEAQSVSKESLRLLIPTVRKDGSQLWYSFNRFTDNDPVWDKVFKNPSPRTYIGKVNMMDLHPKFQSKELIEEMGWDKESDYDLYLHTWMGEPVGQEATAAIDRSMIVAAMERDLELDKHGVIRFGADIAREGNDNIEFYKLQGHKTTDHKTYRKLKTPLTESFLKDFIGEHKQSPCKIDLGYAPGVHDHLMLDGYNVFGINFGGRKEVKQRDKYYDIATEMWFDFADNLERFDIPNDEGLKEELSQRLVTYKTVNVPDGEFKGEHTVKIIEPKRDFKKRIHRSPDKADALLMAYYDPRIKPVPRARYIG